MASTRLDGDGVAVDASGLACASGGLGCQMGEREGLMPFDVGAFMSGLILGGLLGAIFMLWKLRGY